MPGGNKEAYQHIKPIFEAAAAKFNGEPCVTYLGPKSAGNYVKMVHNGIEYGLMQLTSEVYDLLKKAGGLTNDELSSTFDAWNNGRLQSFLIEITSEIFSQDDDLTNDRLVDMILDKAKQKGTGKWTSQNAMDLGIPVPSIDIAVSMREISAFKDMRMETEKLYEKPNPADVDKDQFTAKMEQALYFSFIITYAQGLQQLVEASEEYGYELNMSEVAKIWRAGCIIRADLLDDISKTFSANNKLKNIVMAPAFVEKLKGTVSATREVVAYGATYGIPLPGLSNSLTYFDAITSGRLPLNLIQAQRDHFGSHTYERLDRDGIFHTEWK